MEEEEMAAVEVKKVEMTAGSQPFLSPHRASRQRTMLYAV